MKLAQTAITLLALLSLKVAFDLSSLAKICNFDDLISNPLVMGGVGYGIYSAGDEDERRERRTLIAEKRNAFHIVFNSRNLLNDIAAKLNMKLDVLTDALNEMDSNLISYARSTQSAIQYYCENDVPGHERQEILRKVKHHSKRMRLINLNGRSSLNTTDDSSAKEDDDAGDDAGDDKGEGKGGKRLRFRRRRKLNKNVIINRRKPHRKVRIKYRIHN